MSMLSTIGDLARRTGLTVKAVRFYADRGLVPPSGRNPAGHRVFDETAAARLDLVRTLRELGLDLATIRRILDREVSLGDVAATHVAALDTQIRTLRSRRAVLAVIVERGSDLEETTSMHRLTTLSAYERSRLIEDFLGAVFHGLDDRPGLDGIRRSMTPELPADPAPEQLEAWVELAELTGAEDFRAALAEMTAGWAAEHAGTLRPDPAALVRDRVAPLVAAGVGPESPAADPVVREFAAAAGYLRTVNDPRRQRYLELLSVINGWPAPESLAPTLTWFLEAVEVRA